MHIGLRCRNKRSLQGKAAPVRMEILQWHQTHLGRGWELVDNEEVPLKV